VPATRKKSNASQPAPLLRYSLQRQGITRGVAFSIIVGSCTTYRCICLCCYTHCSRLNGELPKRCSTFSASAWWGQIYPSPMCPHYPNSTLNPFIFWPAKFSAAPPTSLSVTFQTTHCVYIVSKFRFCIGFVVYVFQLRTSRLPPLITILGSGYHSGFWSQNQCLPATPVR
jgi:hypothetical protein